MDKLLKSFLLLIALVVIPVTAYAQMSFNPITGKLDKVGAIDTDYNKILTISTEYTNDITINDHETVVLTLDGNVLTVG